MQHDASGAEGPAFARIDEIYVKEIGVGVRHFRDPRAAAIVGREDLTSRAHGPATVANQTRSIESNVRAIAHETRLPVHAAVTRTNDRAARTDQTSMRLISKRTAEQQMLCGRRLSHPVCATVACAEHDAGLTKR